MVDKLVKRSLLKDKYTFLAINLVFLICIVFAVISVYSLQYGLGNYYQYVEKTNLEDFRAYSSSKLTTDEITTIEDDYNVELEQTQLVKYNYQNSTDDDVEVKINPYNKNQTLTMPVIITGSYPENKAEMVLSQEFAELNDLKINDHFVIDDVKFKIVGLASFPELMYPMKDGSLIPDNKTTASALINQASFDQLFSDSMINELVLGQFKSDLNKSQRKAIYVKMQEELIMETAKTNIVGQVVSFDETMNLPRLNPIVDRSDNMNFNMIELEYQFLGIIVAGLSAIIGIITIMLSIFLFKNIVGNQRRELGIMIAEGISTFEIAKSYQKYFLISLIITVVIGVFSGLVTVVGMEYLFAMFFNIIHYSPSISLYILIISVVLIILVLVMSLVQLFAIRKNIHQPVLELISNVSTQDKKPKLKTKSRKSKLNFKRRMQINTIKRNIGKSLLLIYGIVFSTFLLVFGLIMTNAVTNMEDNIKGDYFSYDYIVNFSPIYQTDPKLDNENTLITINGELTKINDVNQDFEDITMINYDPKNEYINFDFKKPLTGNEVVVTQSFADVYQVKIGDELTINNKLNRNEFYQFKVVDIANVKHEETIYGSKSGIKEMLDLDKNYYNSLVGLGEKKEIVIQNDENALYYSIDDLISGIKSYSQMMNFMIIYISFLAGLLAFIAIGIISKIIISSNKKTISIMKVLGYDAKEINTLLLSGYKWIVIVGTIITFPIAVEGCKLYIDFIMGLVPDMNYPIYVTVSYLDFVVVFGFITTIYFISAKLTTRKINKIKLSESLKVDE